MELPAVSLKAIVLVHWVLTTWACMYSWLPSAYAWGNFTVLAMGVWAMAHKDSIDAVSTFLIGLLFSILSDILMFALYYESAENIASSHVLRDLFRFSAGMAILSLLIKPLSCFFIYHMYRERGGEYNISLGFTNGNQDCSAYQSIDHQNAPTEQVNKTVPSLY
ncbi:type-1 angiotensin II receptor-associated protein [Microcaecilia unicolor]|uniref:Type-1 angiotensin II receptor-associated protein n=1 Tax=Microcaecilia unicolor TaxID=1415580 RepID=A0A6P7WVN8_9AMPH|nr:type-1 angiotensin II receptor-associated protein [Microcaecilia unicolor]